MSNSLVIDTSTNRTVVGVVTDGKLIWSGHRDGATAHGPSLPLLVQEAIAQHKIDQVIVGMGPGPLLDYELVLHLLTHLHVGEVSKLSVCVHSTQLQHK